MLSLRRNVQCKLAGELATPEGLRGGEGAGHVQTWDDQRAEKG